MDKKKYLFFCASVHDGVDFKAPSAHLRTCETKPARLTFSLLSCFLILFSEENLNE